jgi:hypothetical protein
MAQILQSLSPELAIFKDRDLGKWGSGEIIQYIPLIPYFPISLSVLHENETSLGNARGL